MTYPKTQYSSVSIPPSMVDVTLKITGEMMAREGVAFSAEVLRDGKVVGTIENQGYGGGTWFHQRDRETATWWDEAVTAYGKILVDEGDEFGDQFAAEMLADALYENAALKRDLDRKRSPLVRFDRDNEGIKIYKGKWDDQLRKQVLAKAKESGVSLVERWVKGEGWEVIS